MRWAEHVTCMGTLINAHDYSSDRLKGRDLLGDLEVDGKIILKWI
jgi:hypothetical protein